MIQQVVLHSTVVLLMIVGISASLRLSIFLYERRKSIRQDVEVIHGTCDHYDLLTMRKTRYAVVTLQDVAEDLWDRMLPVWRPDSKTNQEEMK